MQTLCMDQNISNILQKLFLDLGTLHLIKMGAYYKLLNSNNVSARYYDYNSLLWPNMTF